MLKSCKSLDDLQSELLNNGFHLSRTATYLRLQPRSSVSIQGKKHVKTVPVKLTKAQNVLRKKHIASNFAFTTINHMKEACSLMGSKVCNFLSCDDKARVPIDLTAANKQAALLMHMEYKIKLPDHDFVIATKHKLIPSVYGICKIKENGFSEAVTYSGPTYVAIRSGKHDSSNAAQHGKDIERMMNLDDFKNEMMMKDLTLKPILFMTVDGGPDENLRFPKTLAVAIHRFRKHDLDVQMTAAYAPGRSAYNAIERRMAPLSRELAGLILPHDKYGSHLDDSGHTTDTDLEKLNFKHAGQTLAEVWNIKIDSYPVTAEYIEPKGIKPPAVDRKWAANHVRQSQYLLQIVRCDDRSCCGPWRSNWKIVMHS